MVKCKLGEKFKRNKTFTITTDASVYSYNKCSFCSESMQAYKLFVNKPNRPMKIASSDKCMVRETWSKATRLI